MDAEAFWSMYEAQPCASVPGHEKSGIFRPWRRAKELVRPGVRTTSLAGRKWRGMESWEMPREAAPEIR